MGMEEKHGWCMKRDPASAIDVSRIIHSASAFSVCPWQLITAAEGLDDYVDEMSKKCSNNGSDKDHRHANLQNGVAKHAGIWPDQLQIVGTKLSE